ncbi:MAG TPA: hypothetical protein VIJ11_10410 [Galbitalea sp.]
MTVTKRRTCANCGSRAVPIVYGMPGFDLFEAADRGEVALGGCIVDDELPTWRCTNDECGLEFGRLSPRWRQVGHQKCA